MLPFLRHSSAMLALMAALFCTSLPAADADYVLDDPPTDMKISLWDGSVYVSAGRRLIFLNADLTENASVPTIGGQIAHAYNDTGIFMACTDANCRIYYIFWPHNEVYDFHDVDEVQESVSTTLASVQLENQFYVGTTDNENIKLKQFDPNSPDPQLRSFDKNIVNENFYRRQFLYAFESEDFVYFLVRDNGTNDLTTNIRIMRVCQEPGGTNLHFDAVYEAVLECGDFTVGSQVTISDSVVEMEAVGHAAITIAVTTNSKTNICIFSVDNINMEMDMSYRDCVSGDNNAREIPLVWYSDRTCGHFSVESSESCDFDLVNSLQEVPALAAFDSVVGENILQLNESDEITAILAFKVDSTDLLLVAHSKNEEHFLAKYHIRSRTDVQLVSEEEVGQPIILLRWNELWEQMYGANIERVFDIPLENCSHFTTCSSCTSSADPVCGWCALENTCSRQINCPSGAKPGHWVQDEEHCIASISLDPPSIALDYVHNVELTIIPPTAALPSSPPGEYMCSLYDENSSYNITTPFVGGTCQLPHTMIPGFTGTHIDLVFVLTIDGTPTEHVVGTSTLTLYNCTQLTTCGECVEASTSCGWCVYDHICTGKSSNCREEPDWRSVANISHDEDGSMMTADKVCPTVLTPVHGVYTHPVMVERNISLATLNMPPEITGFHYGCLLKYRNNSLQLRSTYHDETTVTCEVLHNQVQLSSDVDNGWETVHLDLLWVRESDGYAIPIDTQTVNLYDCMELGSDCTSCFSANIDSGFECIWCDYTFMNDACTVVEYCQRDSTLIKNISGCSIPFIESISPMSGPREGGTELTLNGYNLGAVASNVTVQLENNQLNETIPCLVDDRQYVPGRQIVCTTQRGLEGEYRVTVKDQRGYNVSKSSPKGTFHYVAVVINEMVPLLGPKAGGTEIVVTGTGLDIGSPGNQRVFIGDVECTIRSVEAEEIRCTSQRSPSAGLRRVHVTIDKADVDTYQYNYTENPVFTSVHPQSIIPAGGIMLTFRGHYLNVVLNPFLSLTVNNYTYESPCKPKSSSVLKCIAPRLPVTAYYREGIVRRNTDYTTQINYTVVMDGAEGPSSAEDNLQLGIKPNPVFTAIHVEDVEYTISSKTTIRIMGMNIDSVLADEIRVLVAEDECTLAEMSAMQIRCWPPDIADPGDKEVKVIIANNSLNYSVGFLRYRSTSTSSSDNNIDIIVVILPVVAGVIVLLLTCLAVLVGTIGLAVRRRRSLKASQRGHTFGQQGKELQMMSATPNVYNRRHGGSSHDYDTIPDVLAEMQMACTASQGMDFTIAPTRNSNLYSSEDEGKGSSTSSHSRPNSSSTSGSVSGKYVRHAPLPALPVSTSDEYVAMGSFSVSETVSSVEKGHSTVQYVDILHQPSTEVASANGATNGKEKAPGGVPFIGVKLNGAEETDLKASEERNASQESSA